LVNHLAVHS